MATSRPHQPRIAREKEGGTSDLSGDQFMKNVSNALDFMIFHCNNKYMCVREHNFFYFENKIFPCVLESLDCAHNVQRNVIRKLRYCQDVFRKQTFSNSATDGQFRQNI